MSKSNVFKKLTTNRKSQYKKEKTMRSRKRSTKYIIADTTKCEACWICIDECEYNVLGKVNLWFHKHIIIKNGDECRGCLKCVSICPNGVFEPVTQSKTGMGDVHKKIRNFKYLLKPLHLCRFPCSISNIFYIRVSDNKGEWDPVIPGNVQGLSQLFRFVHGKGKK
jgi:ferredoxin